MSAQRTLPTPSGKPPLIAMVDEPLVGVSGEAAALAMQSAAQIFYMCVDSTGFASSALRSITLDDVRVCDVSVKDGVLVIGRKAAASVIMRTRVTEEMCNLRSNMHGGCAAFLSDTITSCAIAALGEDKLWWSTGVSTSLDMHYIRAMPLGCELLLVGSIVSRGRQLARTEFKIVDAADGKLYAFGAHTKLDARL